MEALEKSPLGNDWSMWLFQLKNTAQRLMTEHLKLATLVSVPVVARKSLTSPNEAQHDISVAPSPASSFILIHSQKDNEKGVL